MSPVRSTTLLSALLLVALAPVATRAQDIPSTGRTDPRLARIDALMRSFLREHELPGAALAIARDGRLLYARGFGYADVATKELVQPDSLFRIASVSKPLTSAAVMKLVEDGKLALDEHPFEALGISVAGEKADPRLARITIQDLLTHAGGWDRGKSGDPMFMSKRIAKALGVKGAPEPLDIVRWMSTRPLDFDPGTKSVYSNFGYCLLGCVIEKRAGMPYERYVQQAVLAPAGVTGLRLGATAEAGRAKGEVRYYSSEPDGPSVLDGTKVPNCYGGWCLETMKAHGGWIASAPDLVRFASALGEPGRVLTRKSVKALWARPAHEDPKADTYYALGWSVRPMPTGLNTWHSGSLPGTSTLLVRRCDGFVWAVLFNSREGDPAQAIDNALGVAINSVKEWPEGEAFD